MGSYITTAFSARLFHLRDFCISNSLFFPCALLSGLAEQSTAQMEKVPLCTNRDLANFESESDDSWWLFWLLSIKSDKYKMFLTLIVAYLVVTT